MKIIIELPKDNIRYTFTKVSDVLARAIIDILMFGQNNKKIEIKTENIK
jgi:hypothetical protein